MARVRRVLFSPFVMLPLTMLFWAGNNVVGRAVAPDIGPMALSFWRWLLALCILLPFAWPHLRAQRELIRTHWTKLFVLGVLSVAAFTSLHYAALRYTTAINTSLLATTIPAAIVGASWLFVWYVFKARSHLRIPYVLLFAWIVIEAVATKWHYLIDLPAGIVLAAAAIWIANRLCAISMRTA